MPLVVPDAVGSHVREQTYHPGTFVPDRCTCTHVAYEPGHTLDALSQYGWHVPPTHE